MKIPFLTHKCVLIFTQSRHTTSLMYWFNVSSVKKKLNAKYEFNLIKINQSYFTTKLQYKKNKLCRFCFTFAFFIY